MAGRCTGYFSVGIRYFSVGLFVIPTSVSVLVFENIAISVRYRYYRPTPRRLFTFTLHFKTPGYFSSFTVAFVSFSSKLRNVNTIDEF